MTPAQLSRTVLHTVRRAVESGELAAAAADGLPERVMVEVPPRRGRGDYAVSVAFQLASRTGTAPREVARVLQRRLGRQDGVRSVEIAGGGFLNVTLADEARAALVAELAGAEWEYGPDEPAADIARWSAATGDDPASLAVRTWPTGSLFRVQYAHARTRALRRNAHDLGFHSDAYAVTSAAADARAGALLALLADHQRVSERSAPGPHARHLEAVAEAFFDFHDHCPLLPRGDEKPQAAHRARLALVEATGTVLAGGLSQLGVTAPEHL